MDSLAGDGGDDQQHPPHSNTNEPTNAQTTSPQPHNPPIPPPPQQQQPPCPRCSSTNTKFCYYNNYSLSQPRYICKTCRRYWTQGGSLRKVPVGGGSRKPKRRKLSSPSPQTQTSSLQTVGTASVQDVHQHGDETVPKTLTIGEEDHRAGATTLPLSSSYTYQMLNLINPNYQHNINHHQLPLCGGGGGFEGGFYTSLMAVQSMGMAASGGCSTHSFHPPPPLASNYHRLISSSTTNSGSGLFNFAPVGSSHDQPSMDFLTGRTINDQPFQANHLPAGSVDARLWSVGGGVNRDGDKTIKDEEVVRGGGGGSCRVPPPTQ